MHLDPLSEYTSHPEWSGIRLYLSLPTPISAFIAASTTFQNIPGLSSNSAWANDQKARWVSILRRRAAVELLEYDQYGQSEFITEFS